MRTAVVTGGAGGIGAAVCRRLARAGFQVVAVGRDKDRLARLADQAAADGLDITTFRADVTSQDDVARLAESVASPAVVVNNAGAAETARLERLTLASWEGQLRANATSAFLVTRAFLPRLREEGWGRVIAVASTASHVGAKYTGAYAASKHALLGLVRSLAAEVAGTQITSNAVCPTFVRTPLTERSMNVITERTGRVRADAEADLAATSPLGRLLEPDEVAAAVAFFASEEAGCVNGQSLVLDGGGLQL